MFCAGMAFSGVSYVLLDQDTLAATANLHYPAYFYQLLGTGKLIGIAVLLLPVTGKLKEWAYAGFAINLIGALWSHLVSGSPASLIAAPLMMGVLYVGSYYFYSQRARQEQSAPLAKAV
jgi:hypothetical protein